MSLTNETLALRKKKLWWSRWYACIAVSMKVMPNYAPIASNCLTMPSADLTIAVLASKSPHANNAPCIAINQR